MIDCIVGMILLWLVVKLWVLVVFILVVSVVEILEG